MSRMQCAAFVRWIDTSSRTLPPRGYEQAYGIWNGVDFLPVLEKELGLTEASIAVYEVCNDALALCVHVDCQIFHTEFSILLYMYYACMYMYMYT